jgi:hypothetical protein
MGENSPNLVTLHAQRMTTDVNVFLKTNTCDWNFFFESFLFLYLARSLINHLTTIYSVFFYRKKLKYFFHILI